MEILVNYLIAPSVQIALIIGLAEALKRAGVSRRFIPIIDVALGVLFGVLSYGVILHQNYLVGAFVGVAVGLSACGLFSGIKNLSAGADKQDGGEDKPDDVDGE